MRSHKRSLRRKKKVSRRKIFLTALIILAIFSSTWKIVKVVREAIWDGQSRVNLVVDAQNVYLVSFDPGEKKILVTRAPKETYVEAAYGFASYPFGAIYDLGEIEKRGGQVLAFTAQEFFATPIDGWIKTQSANGQEKFEINNELSAKGQILKLLQDSIRPFEKEEVVRTNLTLFDEVRLWRQIRQVRFDKVNFLDLEADGVLTDSSLPGGLAVKIPNLDELDSLLSPFLIDEAIREESLKIEVLNSTGKTGLGNRVVRLVTNLGGEVISLGNQEEKIDNCLIRVKKEDANRKTVQRLQKIFSCELEESGLSESRSDLVLIIGDDYWQKLSQERRY